MNKIWYYSYCESLIEATEYLRGMLKRINNKNELNQFFEDYEKETTTQFIFESNNIEREGPSEEETKKLVLDNYELLDESINFLGLKKVIFSNLKNVELLGIESDKSKIDLEKGYVKFTSDNKKKMLLLVRNQLISIMRSRIFIAKFIKSNIEEILSYINMNELEDIPDETYEHIIGRHYTPGAIRYFKRKINDNDFYAINEDNIKLLHEGLSRGCKNNNNGKAGEYRPEGAYVDLNTVFIEPSLIEPSMEKFITDHKERYKNENFNPFIEATKLSGDFVMIHPFGDFNGRLSRILVNMILLEEGIPFLLVLRSNRANKNKYITSMKRYYRGDPKAYLTLICSVFINQVKLINEKLMMAGISPIEPIELSEEEKKLLKEQIELLYKNTRSFK